MDDFEIKVINDVIVVVVTFSRATYKEAGELKKILNEYHEKRFKKIVVDIRECEFIDSTFLGVLVFSLKSAAKIGGDIRIIQPSSIVKTLMEKVGTIKVFNVFDTIDAAVNSYNSADLSNHYVPGSNEVFI